MDANMFYIANDLEQADAVVSELKHRGLRDEQISFVLMETSQSSEFQKDPGSPVYQNAAGVSTAIGGIAGTVIGATVGLMALGSVGPLIASGPLLAILGGGAAGGASGGLVGALIGSGLPKSSGSDYSDQLKRGGVLLVAHPHDRSQAHLVTQVFASYGLIQIPECELNINGPS